VVRLVSTTTARTVYRCGMWCKMWCMGVKRLSVTLEPVDQSTVSRFQTEGTPEHGALVSWAAGHDVDPRSVQSDAGLLRALLRAGAEALRMSALEEGYAQLAAATSADEQAEVREARRRHMNRTGAP
jgi:hypothetical protein